MKPTLEMNETLQAAYDFFNGRLFSNKLPGCLILIQRKSKAMGYFSPKRFFNVEDKDQQLDEIAISPDFIDLGDQESMQTLVHEMVHQWQQHHGKPSRGGYHNKEWGVKMESIGLMPSSTGKPGGKKTGQKIGDYAIENGNFIAAFNEFMRGKHRLMWASRVKLGKGSSSKTKSKVKYSCPECGQNAWAKPSAVIGCWGCNVQMESEE